MRLAIWSDTRLPTSAQFAGHGLGKINLAIAEGLRALNHDVTLFAGFGSEFSGSLVQSAREEAFYANGLGDFDAILDAGHDHGASLKHPDAPIVNLSHDRESKPGPNAVFVSEAHKAYHRQPGRVIHNGVDVDDYPLITVKQDYVAFLALHEPHKGPLAALEAARMAGVPLKMAGPGQPLHGTDYVGMLSGKAKTEFLGNARALLVPAGMESAGITCLEAAACGTPVIAFDLGGLPEYVRDGVTGYLVDSTEEMADTIHLTYLLEPALVRLWVERERNLAQMVHEYERALEAVARGERW